jgi:hypothetical protein
MQASRHERTGARLKQTLGNLLVHPLDTEQACGRDIRYDHVSLHFSVEIGREVAKHRSGPRSHYSLLRAARPRSKDAGQLR